MHINEVDGLMPHFSNRPLGEHWLSLSCSSGAQLIASEVMDQISFPRECLCCKWPFLSLSGNQLKPHRNGAILREIVKHKLLRFVADCLMMMIKLQGRHLTGLEWISFG